MHAMEGFFKIIRSSSTNISKGSRSPMPKLRRSSTGRTTRPRSSTFLIMPVDFMCSLLTISLQLIFTIDIITILRGKVNFWQNLLPLREKCLSCTEIGCGQGNKDQSNQGGSEGNYCRAQE